MIDYAKLPPQAIELEDAVLGAMLIDRDGVLTGLEILQSQCFYSDQNRLIFEAMEILFAQGKQIDQLTVSEQLKKTGKLESSGGPYYIAQLTSKVSRAAHIEDHARKVAEKYLQRELINISQETIKDAYENTTDVFELIGNHETKLLNMMNPVMSDQEKHISIHVVKAMKPKEISDKGIEVKNPLKSHVKYLQGPDLIIIAARPSMGKTAYAMQIAMETAEQGYPVAVFSLEMSGAQLTKRMLSAKTGISYEKINNDEIHEYEQLNYIQAGKEISLLPIYIDDMAAINEIQLRSKAIRMKRKYGVELIILDYLQLMSGIGKTQNREQEISNISKACKRIAKELNIPFIALSQLSRKCEDRSDKKPMLSDLRESGAIEQDADIVEFLFRAEYYGIENISHGNEFFNSTGLAEIITAKNRNGKLGTAVAEFKTPELIFKEHHSQSIEPPKKVKSYV